MNAFSRPIASILPLMKFAAKRHLDMDQLLEGTRLNRYSFLDSEFQIMLDQEIRLTNNLQALCPEPELPLALGRFYETRTQGITGQLLLSAQDLQEALDILVRFSSLSHVFFQLTIENRNKVCRLHLKPRVSLGRLQGFMMERDLSAAVTVVEDLFAISQQELVAEVGLTHSPLASKQVYKDFLIENTLFNQPSDYVDIPLHLLSMKTARDSSNEKQLLYQRCRTEMLLRGEVNDSVSEKVQWYFQCHDALPDMKEMAEHLHMTERTLRRKLTAEGVSFRDILNEARQQKAIELLANRTLSIESVAEILGYSEASAFINAFRRWQGKTPNQFRQLQATLIN